MKKYLFTISVAGTALLGVVALNSSTAIAGVDTGTVRWQTIGGGCVPDDETIQGNLYQAVTGGGRVKYRGTHANELRFSCPITGTNPSTPAQITVLSIYYQDPDGPGGDFKVSGRLLRFAKSNGDLSEVCKVESDKSGQWQSSFSTSCGTIDFARNLYWLEVIVSRRQSSTLTVEFNGAELVDTVQ